MTAKILLVDDDPTLRRFLTEFLEGEGYQVVTAREGGEALRLAYREQPNLVVLDVMMPGMDGWEVTQRLRELSDLPIILLTAKTSEADKLRGFQLGVDDYLTKPFSFAELAARIQAVLNRAKPAVTSEPNPVPIGDLLLDLEKHELLRGGETVSLTPTEYRLLEVLVRHRGKAMAEGALMQELWGGTLQDASAVRRYIWLLRQKIEPDPANPRWILNVRGYGYRLE